jgi:hypothetical protein
MTYPPDWGALEILEFRVIEETYRIYHGNKSHVAKALNLSLRAVRYKVRMYEKLGLIPEQFLEQHTPHMVDSPQQDSGTYHTSLP